MRRILFVLCSLLIALSSVCYAGRYYMSPTGSDSNDGRTTQAAWGTLQHADDMLVAGDTLFVMGGNYTDTQYFWSTMDGAPGRPIVIMAYPGQRPVFTGLLNGEYGRFFISRSYYDIVRIASIDGHSQDHNCAIVVVTGASNVNFKNCLFEGSRAPKLEQTCGFGVAVSILSGSNYVTMDACTVQYAGEGCYYGNQTQNNGEMVVIQGAVHHIVLKNGVYRFGPHDEIRIASEPGGTTPPGPMYVIIKNNEIDQGGTDDWYSPNNFGGGYGVGIDRRIPGDSSLQYIVVEGNRFRGGASIYREKCPIYVEGGCGITIRKNLIWNSTNRAINFSTQFPYTYVKHNFIYNNTVAWSGDNSILILVGRGHDPESYFNNNLFANNLFYDAREHRDMSWSESGYMVALDVINAVPQWWTDQNKWGSNVWRNNVFREVNIGGDTLYHQLGNGIDQAFKGRDYLQKRFPQTFINNLFFQPDGTTPIDPKFGQYSFAGVTILPTSPCVDAGINMNPIDVVVQTMLTSGDIAWAQANGLTNLLYYGSAPDIGAYEVNTGSPVTPGPVNGVHSWPIPSPPR